jgi:hypothetical protein
LEVNLVLPADAMGCSPYGTVSAPELFSSHEQTTLFPKSKNRRFSTLGVNSCPRAG